MYVVCACVCVVCVCAQCVGVCELTTDIVRRYDLFMGVEIHIFLFCKNSLF